MATGIKRLFKSCIRFAELKAARTYLRIGQERCALIILLFHTVYLDETEKNRRLVYPPIGMTIHNFDRILNIFLQHEYCFISPDHILQGLDHRKRYVLITFDDGYFNNTRVLPLLKAYRIPALFFISANYIRDGKGYWWDAVFRACRAKGMAAERIDRYMNRLKTYTHDRLEQCLRDDYGLRIDRPVGDLDRPFTPEELKDFSRESCVYIGNHTSDHAILTNYAPEEVKKQIADAQETIYEWIRIRPNAISYPNGNHSPAVLNIAREAGLEIGISVDFRKNYLPLEKSELALMCLGRFMPDEATPVDHQCDLYRSDLILPR